MSSKKISELPLYSGEVPNIADFPINVMGTTYRARKTQLGQGLQEITDVGDITTNPIYIGASETDGLALKKEFAQLYSETLSAIQQTGFSLDNFYCLYTDVSSGITYQAYLSGASGLIMDTSGNGLMTFKTDLVDHNVTIQCPNKSGTLPIVNVSDNFTNDTTASAGGIPIGGMYHTAGVVKIRLT